MPALAHPDSDAFGSPDSASTAIVKTEYDDTFGSMMFNYPSREAFPAQPSTADIPYHMSMSNIAVACAMPNDPRFSLCTVQHIATQCNTLKEPRLHPHYLNPIMAGSRQPLFPREEMGMAFDTPAEESVYPIQQSIERDDVLPFGDASTLANELCTWTGYVKHPESSERSSLKREAERLRETRSGHAVGVERGARLRV